MRKIIAQTYIMVNGVRSALYNNAWWIIITVGAHFKKKYRKNRRKCNWNREMKKIAEGWENLLWNENDNKWEKKVNLN